jgi:hypothetical protein
VKASLEWLVALKKIKGSVDGPAISDDADQAYSMKNMTDSLLYILEDLFEPDRDYSWLTLHQKRYHGLNSKLSDLSEGFQTPKLQR